MGSTSAPFSTATTSPRIIRARRITRRAAGDVMDSRENLLEQWRMFRRAYGLVPATQTQWREAVDYLVEHEVDVDAMIARVSDLRARMATRMGQRPEPWFPEPRRWAPRRESRS